MEARWGKSMSDYEGYLFVIDEANRVAKAAEHFGQHRQKYGFKVDAVDWEEVKRRVQEASI